MSAEEGFALLDQAREKLRTNDVYDDTIDGLITDAVKLVQAEMDQLMWEITELENER